MNRSLKIFLTCACGAGIDTLVSLQLKQWYDLNFWALIIGMIFGGLFGYIFIEFKQFIHAIPKAWKMTRYLWEEITQKIIFLYRILANWQIYKTILYSFLATILVTANIFIVGFLLSILFGIKDFNALGLALFVFIGGAACFLELLTIAMQLTYGLENYVFPDSIKNLCKTCIFKFNPVSMIIYWPLKGIWLFCKLVYLDWKVVITFFKNLFILTHSNWRLLCAIDSMIGISIGFAFGNAIIGFLAGGIFGLLNYEVLSVRILKLVPARIKNNFPEQH